MTQQRNPSPWEADYAALSQQVSGLETDYRDLKSVVVTLDKKIDASFAALSAKFDARNVTPWAVIIATMTLILGGMTTVGYLARQPLVDGISSLRQELTLNAELRRQEDRRLADKLSELQGKHDRLSGAFDLMTRK